MNRVADLDHGSRIGGASGCARPRGLKAAALVSSVLAIVLSGCRSNETGTTGPTPTTQASPISREVSSGPVTAVVEADRDAVAIPGNVVLTLTVTAERGVEVTMPGIGAMLGPFGVTKIDRADPAADDLAETQRWTVTLEPFVPGDAEIPPLTVAWRDARERADGSRTVTENQLETPPLAIAVSQSLADVKGPAAIDVPFSQKVILWLVGVIAVMAAAALLARRWAGRRKRAAAPQKAMVPHEWALAELDRLAAENLIARGLIQEFYYRINFLLRRYIELRFGLAAGEQTSEEFVRDMQRSDRLSAPHKDVLRRFVAACDPVKYARYRPSSDDIDWVQSAARDFVLQTAGTTDASVSADSPGRPALEEVGA